MKYRVHLFAKVRVEHELDAESAEEAARCAFEADLDLYQRFDRPGQEFAEEVDDIMLVDPLTDEADEGGRRRPDCENAQWLQVTEEAQPDGTKEVRVVPAPPFDTV